MAPPTHRQPGTAHKDTRRHDAHDVRAHRAAPGRACAREDVDDGERREQGVRARARMVVDDELDFVFRP
jgi:hypothetical protein